MRPPVDTIPAPPFPRGIPWANTAPLRMDQQIGRPVLVEFWDFCRGRAVLEGHGRVRANGEAIEVSHPGCYPLRPHGRHTAAVLELEVGEGVTCHAVCFTPGVVAQAEASASA